MPRANQRGDGPNRVRRLGEDLRPRRGCVSSEILRDGTQQSERPLRVQGDARLPHRYPRGDLRQLYRRAREGHGGQFVLAGELIGHAGADQQDPLRHPPSRFSRSHKHPRGSVIVARLEERTPKDPGDSTRGLTLERTRTTQQCQCLRWVAQGKGHLRTSDHSDHRRRHPGVAIIDEGVPRADCAFHQRARFELTGIYWRRRCQHRDQDRNRHPVIAFHARTSSNASSVVPLPRGAVNVPDQIRLAHDRQVV